MNKVKYFRPDIFELDGLNINPPIIAPGQLVQAYMPVDRTGIFNPFNMMYEPIPSVANFNKSLSRRLHYGLCEVLCYDLMVTCSRH